MLHYIFYSLDLPGNKVHNLFIYASNKRENGKFNEHKKMILRLMTHGAVFADFAADSAAESARSCIASA
jgi:hypothetical protein